MSARPVVAIACMLGTLFAPWTAAIDPTGDDAGSGADAADTHELALVLAPATYGGTVTRTSDRWDFYAAEVHAGDLLRVALTGPATSLNVVVPVAPGGGSPGAYATLGSLDHGEEKTFPMAGDGTVYLRVDGGVGATPVERTYTFAFDRTAAATWTAVSRTSGWVVAEVRADTPVDLYYEIRLAVTADAREPWSALMCRETDAAILASSPSVGFAWAQTGLARTVTAGGMETGPVWGPVGAHVADDWLSVSGAWKDFQGHLRVAAFRTSDLSDVELRVATSGPAVVAWAEGEGLMEWGNEDAEGADGFVTPVLSSQGPMETEWQVEDRFLGVVDSWFRQGELAGPPGTWTLAGEESWPILRDASAGRWNLGLEGGGNGLSPGPVNGALAAGAVHAAGFALPNLGVASLRLAGHDVLAPVCRQTC